MQGDGIPVLYESGYFDEGNSFFLAPQEIKEAVPASSDLPSSAAEAAEQVCVKYIWTSSRASIHMT